MRCSWLIAFRLCRTGSGLDHLRQLYAPQRSWAGLKKVTGPADGGRLRHGASPTLARQDPNTDSKIRGRRWVRSTGPSLVRRTRTVAGHRPEWPEEPAIWTGRRLATACVAWCPPPMVRCCCMTSGCSWPQATSRTAITRRVSGSAGRERRPLLAGGAHVPHHLGSTAPG
jgi:hypothetical protein